MQQPSSGPAFAQMTSQLFEEAVRKSKRLPEMEALDIPTKLIWGQNDPYFSTDVGGGLPVSSETFFSACDPGRTLAAG